MTGRAESPTLMIVGAVDEGGAESLFDQFPWTIRRVSGCLQFLIEIFRAMPRVVVCEEHLPDGNWRDIVGVAETLYNPPPVIVTSRLADEHLWTEVLSLGGYDVLAKPLEGVKLRCSVQLAWEHSATQRQVAEAPRNRCGAMAT
jgi:FixJ family two-component response regulator